MNRLFVRWGAVVFNPDHVEVAAREAMQVIYRVRHRGGSGDNLKAAAEDSDRVIEATEKKRRL